MELGDFDGAAAGTFGGLVKWYQDPHRGLPIKAAIIATAASCAGAGLCGAAAKEYILWKHADIPHGMMLVIASFVGLCSSPIIQAVTGAVSLSLSVVVPRIQSWVQSWLPKLPAPPDGTTPAPGPDKPKS